VELNFHKNHRLLFGVVFWGFVALSLFIAVFPATWVHRRNAPLPESKPMTDLQREGLHIFINNGCQYCHTQQVRPIKMDETWGRPSAPADYARLHRPGIVEQTPAVLGSERTGPDLTNIGERQPSKVWQYMHLYDPRSVVKESIMPSFPWLFKVEKNPPKDAFVVSLPEGFGPEHGKVIPTHKAKALIAYLLSLKQAPINNEEAKTKKTKPDTSAAKAASTQKLNGAKIYSQKCASCHQSNGKGVPGAFPPMAGSPAVIKKDPTEHIHIVLYGLQGETIDGTSYSSPMPAWAKQLSDEQAAAVINYERTNWGNDAPTVTAGDVKNVREDSTLGKTKPDK
jgi:cytochrome c oxidase cbb3-type subunit 2